MEAGGGGDLSNPKFSSARVFWFSSARVFCCASYETQQKKFKRKTHHDSGTSQELNLYSGEKYKKVVNASFVWNIKIKVENVTECLEDPDTSAFYNLLWWLCINR